MESVAFTTATGGLVQLTWRCCECNKLDLDGHEDTGVYTDGICTQCLREKYPQYAAAIIADLVAKGLPLH